MSIMANFDFKTMLLIGLAAYVGYTNREKIMDLFGQSEEKEADYTIYEVKGQTVHDYGSLNNPVSHQYSSMGRAAGQTASQANEVGLPTSVESVGQNFNGRAFGL